MTLSRWMLLTMRDVWNILVDKIKPRILCSIKFFFQNHDVYEIWYTVVEPDRPQMILRRMRIACWGTKAADTYLEYVILIAFSRQK
jgi:hypothetical protein